jgi:dTDP-4-amino-4,6-dideoxygalactose transaminase
MQIPFLDLQRKYAILKSEVDSITLEVIAEQRFVGGKRIDSFEKAFALSHNVKHCIGVGNATDALFIILKALGIGHGDEVIVPAHGWMSAAEMVLLTGATPIFADVDPESYCLDVPQIEAKVTSRTKAVIPIHLYGQMADIEAIKKFTDAHNLLLIEDAAQAHFSSSGGKMAGSTGIAGVFSFYPSKLLGAMGDGGCITTQNDELAKRCRAIANHGGEGKNEHQVPGLNSRLDTLQAAILELKLKHIDDWLTSRSHIAGYYGRELAKLPEVIPPKISLGNSHNFHLYVIRTKQRDALKKHLAAADIATEIHYPTATPFTQAFSSFGHKPEDFPVSYQLQHELLTLPIYATLTHDEVAYLMASVKRFFA